MQSNDILVVSPGHDQQTIVARVRAGAVVASAASACLYCRRATASTQLLQASTAHIVCTPAQRERLKGFEKVEGDWHAFRDLLHH